MTGPGHLEGFIQWAGVLTAIAGAMITAPAGARRLIKSTGTRIGYAAKRAHSSIDAIWRLLRHKSEAHSATVNPPSAVALAGVGTVSVSARSWSPGASVDQRIEALHQHITDVEKDLAELKQQVSVNRADSEGRVNELRDTLKTDLAELHQMLATQRQEAASVDARGIPVIVLGVFLSGVPDHLSRFLYPLGWAWPLIAVVWVARTSFKAYRGARHDQP